MKLIGGAGLIAVLALAKGLAKIGAKGADEVIQAVGKSADDVGTAATHGTAEVAPAARDGFNWGGATARGLIRGARPRGEADEERKGARQPDDLQP